MSLRAVATAVLLALPVSAAGSAAPLPDSTVGPGSAVPFVAQEPLLCGGAAATMLERFWGARSVYADDYASLVRVDEGGIRTDELAEAMRRRGMRVALSTGDTAVALRTLERGLPLLLLVDADATRRHFVVLTALDGDTARLHDPNWGPDRRVAWRTLRRRWMTAGSWALVAYGREARPEGATAPVLDLPDGALEALRSGRTDEARRIARALLDAPTPRPQAGWRILATARRLDGDSEGALEAWNHVGEPRLDLVEVHGLRDTRYHAVVERSGLRTNRVLKASALALARRRVAALPSLSAARVDYRMAPDGSATAEIAVRERSKTPFGRAGLLGMAGQALLGRSVRLGLGPLTGAAERWELGGSWDPASRGAGVALRAPAPAGSGTVTVSGAWRRERYAVDGGDATLVGEARTVTIGIERWISPTLALGAGLGLGRWRDTGRLGSTSLHALAATRDDRRWVRAEAEGWAGSGPPFGRLGVSAGLRLGTTRVVVWKVRAGVTAVSGHAPRPAWPGAGSGRARTPLLRAHGLVEDGRIAGPVFGRGLAHATVERFRSWGYGPVRWGWIAFADVAAAWNRPDGEATGPFLDVGAGLRLRADTQAVDFTLAYGANGWRWGSTTSVGPPWSGRQGG